MDKQELVDRLVDSWNRKAVADILRLMSSEATYHGRAVPTNDSLIAGHE